MRPAASEGGLTNLEDVDFAENLFVIEDSVIKSSKSNVSGKEKTVN